MLKQSICYPLFKDAVDSPEAFCRLAAEIGYAGIDLWGKEDLPDLAGPAREHGLTITGFIGGGPIEQGFNNPDLHDELQQKMRDSIKLAADHGVPTLIAFTGNRQPGQSDYDGLVQSARGLRPVADVAADHGVTLCVELLSSKVDHRHYLADNSGLGLALCEMIHHPGVKLLFDIYHMQVMEGDVIANLRRCAKWLGHVHTAGVPGRHDLDDQQELNYPGICRALIDMGYDGFVGHEFWANADKAAAMRHAHGVCARAQG